MARNLFGMNGVRAAAVAMVVASGMSGESEAAFVNYTVVATAVTNSGQNLVRYELFANFNGATDTVLNVFNFQASGGWAAHTDAATGFWHKDVSDSDWSSVLNQQVGTWAPQLTGSATLNRPFDSFLLIGGTPTSTNGVTADPSWNGGGANPNGWNMAQLPLYDDLGWFFGSPSPNLQGRVGTAPNTATQVKLGQFTLSANDTAYRTYTLRIAVNNASVYTPVFSDGSFTFPPLLTWFRDLDSDGFGAASSGTLLQSDQPTGYVLSNTDCNDTNAAINPNTIWHRDLDADGFGSASDGTLTQCLQPAGYVLNNSDNCPSIANPLQEDCNSNSIGDVCEIASGSLFDCDADGRPDICEGAVIIAATSPLLAPFGNGSPASYTFTNLPRCYLGTPRLTIEASSDLSGSGEYIAVSIDGGAQEFFFVAGGTDCPTTPDSEARTFTLSAFNALVSDNTLTINLLASASVDPNQCVGGGIRLTLSYNGIPASADCNNNLQLDSCELATGTALDCNGNGIPDTCDIASGFASDCNNNARPDACDIALGTSTDLNGGGVPDECELIVGGSGYASIQAALAAAAPYSTILVANGSYPPIDLSGMSVTLASIHGAANAIIDGGATARCVSMTTPATAATVLQGFTLANGRAAFGAGVLVSNASLNIRDCIIRDNIASESGGGIASIDSSTVIVNTIIDFNQAQSGAGLFVENISTQSVVVVRDSLIDDNVSHFAGAGVQNVGRMSLQRVQLHRNIADGVSGGVWTALVASTELDDCIFCMNLPANIAGPFVELTPNVFSQDCDADGECDADEISAGSEQDCNANDLPDACELDAGSEFDCNNNGVLDSCDIVSAFSTDVDSNAIPDDCQPDCDSDGLPDSWELSEGFARDCNANGFADNCEIDAGAEDKNSNGHLDSCEYARGDLNLDGVVSAADLTALLGFWGAKNPPTGDLNGDGVISAADLTIILGNWGTVP